MTQRRAGAREWNEAFKQEVLSKENAEPLRIATVYQMPDAHDVTKEAAKSVMEAAVNDLGRRVKIREPIQGGLAVPRQVESRISCEDGDVPGEKTCPSEGCAMDVDNACHRAVEEPSRHGELVVCDGTCACGVQGGDNLSDADVLLYVTADATEPACKSGAATATSSPCHFSPKTGRPVAGGVNLCPASLIESTVERATSNRTAAMEWGRQVDMAAHEVLHVLGFKKEIIEADGMAGVVDRGDYGKNWAITTENVRTAARNQFNCSVLDGMDLENEGGLGTEKEHWEARLTEDIMNPVAGAFRRALTNLTMAFLEDTGWYVGERSMAVRSFVGANKGCLFFTKGCKDVSSDGTPFVDDFCDPDKDASSCVASLEAPGQCVVGDFLDGCAKPEPASVASSCWNSKAKTGFTFFGQWRGDRSACLRRNTTSRAMDGTRYTLPGPGTGCFDVACQEDNEGNAQVSIRLPQCQSGRGEVGQFGCQQPGGSPESGYEVVCKTAGSEIDIAGTLPGTLGFKEGFVSCPDPQRLCPAKGACTSWCSRQGRCSDAGQCTCFLGFVGETCDLPSCHQGSCPDGSSCDSSSGFCTENGSGEEIRPPPSPKRQEFDGDRIRADYDSGVVPAHRRALVIAGVACVAATFFVA